MLVYQRVYHNNYLNTTAVTFAVHGTPIFGLTFFFQHSKYTASKIDA
jgi:hypothetical protein